MVVHPSLLLLRITVHRLLRVHTIPSHTLTILKRIIHYNHLVITMVLLDLRVLRYLHTYSLQLIKEELLYLLVAYLELQYVHAKGLAEPKSGHHVSNNRNRCPSVTLY